MGVVKDDHAGGFLSCGLLTYVIALDARAAASLSVYAVDLQVMATFAVTIHACVT